MAVILTQRIHPDILGKQGLLMASAHIAPACRSANTLPVRGLLAGAGVTGALDEGLE
jgi:hypothetical protein